MRKALLMTLLGLLLSHPLSLQAQVEVGGGYHYARTIPEHGAMVHVVSPVATRAGLVTVSLRGEAGYGQETTTYGGWDLYRMNRAWTAGGGPIMGIRLGSVNVYLGGITGVRWFVDEIRLRQRSQSTVRPAGQEAPLLSINASGNRAATALSLGSLDDGRKFFVSGLAGVKIDIIPVVAPFVEYRWWHVSRWHVSPNPFHGLQFGLSAGLF